MSCLSRCVPSFFVSLLLLKLVNTGCGVACFLRKIGGVEQIGGVRFLPCSTPKVIRGGKRTEVMTDQLLFVRQS